jgi:predicted ATPase/DNA-binding CsgD family transcriptional regulator
MRRTSPRTGGVRMAGARPAIPNNLPAPLTSFIGREREIGDVCGLLRSARLVTLTGAGGCGKSRLALEVARRSLAGFRDGVWIVELAALSEGTLVPNACAAALGVPEQRRRSMADALAGALKRKSALLVLDNCEHLLPACAALADILLRTCADLRILATTREGLGVPGETVRRVPSLSVPGPAHLPRAERAADFEAVALFAERAAAVRPGFRVTAHNVRAVADICRRLDGIPLAIELAAARMKALSADQIAARLGDRFRLLSGGGRTVPPRHRTLRAAIDWSYDLLTEHERTLLSRLSVFAGGWTLDGAEAVCGHDGIEHADVLDLLTSLVDKSLVIADLHGSDARYGLLETVRQYGRERLGGGDEEDRVRRRHRDWCIAAAEQAAHELHGPRQTAWLRRLETEHDNFRTALDWSRRETGGAHEGLRLAVALCDFWEIHDHFGEGRAWLESLAAQAGAAPSLLRARALCGAGQLAKQQGDHRGVAALCGAALPLFRAEGDELGEVRTLHLLVHAVPGPDEYARCAKVMERSLALHRAAGDSSGAAYALNCLADAARSEGRYAHAAALLEEALAGYRDAGHTRGQAVVLYNLGQVLRCLNRGPEAAGRLRESLALAAELDNKRTRILCVAGLAAVFAEAAPARAATWLGAAATLLTATGGRFEPVDQAAFDRAVQEVRTRLGETTFAGAWAEGAALTLEEAVATALEPGPPGTPRGDGGERRTGRSERILTARETQVSRLIAEGLSNREIAARLVIAERTAEGHVQSILNKLGFTSRAQIAAWTVERGLGPARTRSS